MYPKEPSKVFIPFRKHQSKPSDESYYSTSSSVNSDFKSFDVEAELGRELVTSDPNSRPSHFRNRSEELVFIFTVMMATASTVSSAIDTFHTFLDRISNEPNRLSFKVSSISTHQ